jgi:tRNA dimethylallyltransferase
MSSQTSRARGAIPVVVGGTGLYFRALTGGLSDMPAIPAEIREELRCAA